MILRSGPLHRFKACESKTDVKALYMSVLGTIHSRMLRTDGFRYISTLLPSLIQCEESLPRYIGLRALESSSRPLGPRVTLDVVTRSKTIEIRRSDDFNF